MDPETGLADWARARLERHAWTRAELIGIPRPQYPRDARKSGFEGLVHATVTVAPVEKMETVETFASAQGHAHPVSPVRARQAITWRNKALASS